MADYTVYFTDLVSQQVLGSLPVSSLSYETVLSAAGSAQFTMPLRTSVTRTYTVEGVGVSPEEDTYPAVDLYPSDSGSAEASFSTPDLTLSTFTPGRIGIFIERDAVVVWSGILWTLNLDVGNNTATGACEGWHSYFARRFLRATKVYSASTDDQAFIAKDLIDWAQAQSGGDIGVSTADVVNTGIKRDRTYYGYERKNIGELVEQLGEVENGFDWYYSTAKTNGTYDTRFLILYPTTGRVTPVRFEMGANVELLKCTVDSTSMAHRVEATGAGEGIHIRSANAVDAASLLSFPLLEDQLSFSDVTSTTTLGQHANKRLALTKKPVIIPTLSVNPDADPAFGSYSVGDQVRVAGSYGLLDLDAQYRITTISVSVDLSGMESISLDLAPAEMYG